MEVNDIFLIFGYNVTNSEKVPVVKNWLGREDLHLIQTVIKAQQDICGTVGLLKTFSVKFKPQHNKTILFL